MRPGTVAEQWRQLDGFKLEADCVGHRTVCSASLTVFRKRDLIDEVAKGKRPIDKLFSTEQKLFISSFYKPKFDFLALRVLGPIRVLRWKIEQAGFSHQLTVEEWRLPDGDDLVEVSIKTPPKDAGRASTDFDNYLRGLRLDPEGAQETKTRTALNYFARVHRDAESHRVRRSA